MDPITTIAAAAVVMVGARAAVRILRSWLGRRGSEIEIQLGNEKTQITVGQNKSQAAADIHAALQGLTKPPA